MIETIAGIIVAVLIIVLSEILSKYFPKKLIAATILVAIAFIYVGFSLKTNMVGFIILEVSVALFFYFLALTGYTRNESLIAYGIMLHGLWDIIHHQGLMVQTDIPVYWPSFCLVIDIISGFYFYKAFSRRGRITKI